jgi:hypothetical protein
MHDVFTTTGWVELELFKGPREDKELYSGEPSASGTIVWCHDISGVFDWVRGWELGPFYFNFNLAGRNFTGGFGQLVGTGLGRSV